MRRTWPKWVEPATPLFLALHGGVLLAESGVTDLRRWALVAAAAILGVVGLAGWRTRTAVAVRAFGLLGLTWVLLYLSGGVQAFFTLWYFMLTPVYGLALGGRAAFAYSPIVGILYPALTLVTDGTLPTAVLWGRVAVITGTGLIVAAMALERKEASEALIRSKDDLIASVSHELRTPLTAVVGLTAELADNVDLLKPADVSEFAETVYRQSLEVANIVDDLLVAARANIGTVTVASMPVDLGSEARMVVDEAGRVHDLSPGRIVVVGTPSPVLADPIRVRQIIRNLVSNAVRYGGDSIEIRFVDHPRRAVLDVADDGAGIPGPEPEAVFEPYSSLGQPSGRPGSIGLGLAVSRTLARLMGGDLTYRRTDDWTVFRLDLPGAG